MFDTIQVKHFIDVVEECKVLKNFSGFSLIEQLQRYSESTKLGINESRFSESKEDMLFYMRFVSDNLNRLSYDEINNSDVISGYLKEYNSSIDEVESLSIIDLELDQLLCELYTEQENPHLKDKAFFLQRQLVDYFKSKYIHEILNLCNSYLVIQKVKTNYYKAIFTNPTAQDWFEGVLDDNNFLDENKKVRKKGFQAISSALFSNKECQEFIFKTNVELKNYIAFLRSKYSAKIKSDKSLSDGYKYESIVKNGIIEYKENNAQ